MASDYIFPLHETSRLQNIGNKARNMRFLAEKGFPTPVTYVCTWDAHARYIREGAQILEDLKAEMASRLDPGVRYAIRSSANFEDGLDSSFAGQFKSFLDVEGVDEALGAICAIWDAVESPAVQAYLARNGNAVQDLKMAVIVQEMVSPQVSGVAFSRNPMTGLDEVLVEAVRGSGEALVQEGVTPARWINKWGTWISTPDAADDAQGIARELIELVVRVTKEIARAYGRPVDLEWVYDGQQVHWVQLREITALDVPIYSNRIAREVFPGVIKPLIWSVNVPLVNGAWVALLSELIGPHDLKPESLAGYYYARAYFNMGALGQIFELLGLPRETLELLMGIEIEGPERPSFKPSPSTYAHVPRMLRFALDKIRFGRRVDAFLPSMEAQLQAFRDKDVAKLSEEQLLDQIDRLYPLAQEAAYYNIVAPLLMQVYNRILKGQLAQMGVEFERFDLTGDMPDLEQFEPHLHLARLHEVYSRLDEDLQARIQESRYGQLSALPGAEPLTEGIARFLEQFGHLSDSGNDFSHQPWRENPDLILEMVVDYPSLVGSDAHQVQRGDLPLPALRRPFFNAIYSRARRFRFYREAVSSLYTFGYGLFRDYFLALGDHFVQRGLLAHRDDIFYLYISEVREMVQAGQLARDGRARVQDRKEEIERVRDITPPETIFGDQAPPLDPNPKPGLRGIPTSRGHYTGRARILEGIQDFGKLQDGDVLVIPYSDVGWTPLFPKAGAVVSEAGGILSHSAIIAREYGIPAVVSVAGACQIPDGMLVTVDGYRGEIAVHERPAQVAAADRSDPSL